MGAVGEGSVVVGDPTDNGGADAGAVYVFARNGTAWSQQAYLKASICEGGDEFGCSVALDNDTLAVGARHEDGAARGVNVNEANNSASIAGAMYVFTRSGDVWTQRNYVKASNTDSADEFGWSVALDGDTLAVGARHEESAATGVGGDQTDDSAVDAGAVYVYR